VIVFIDTPPVSPLESLVPVPCVTRHQALLPQPPKRPIGAIIYGRPPRSKGQIELMVVSRFSRRCFPVGLALPSECIWFTSLRKGASRCDRHRVGLSRMSQFWDIRAGRAISLPCDRGELL